MTQKPRKAMRAARKKAFMEDAATLFLEKGFAATSVNEIVRLAGGSLTTLYELFPTKEALFEQILGDITLVLFAPLKTIQPGTSVESALTTLGERYIRVLGHPKVLAFYRLMVHEAPRFPKLRSVFLSHCESRGSQALAEYLRASCDRGELRIDDIELAIGQFFGMLRGPWHTHAACGALVNLDRERRARIVQGAVRIFLLAYGVAGTPNRDA